MEKTMRRYAAFVLIVFLAITSFSSHSSRAQGQEPAENRGVSAAWRALLRLRSTVTVLHTTVHPDDEDGALLAWLSRQQGVRTGLLTLSRGEGGANLVGPELYDALGILRTEELLAAGRYYGVEQMFTRVTDFGFSKRLDETLERWGKDVALGDVVHAFRLYRPDIIVSRFHGKPRDGHGHHQAAGLLSIEAFKASADPHRFPEHFKEGLRPWQVKKLYLSVRESDPMATLKIDVGEYDPLTGKSYREIARDGLSHHRSQGAGQVRATPGSSLTAVALADSAIPTVENTPSLFDGIDTTIAGMSKLAGATNIAPELTEISNRIETAISKFDALKPWGVASELAAGMKATRTLREKISTSRFADADTEHLFYLLTNKEGEFNTAMHQILGLAMEVLVDSEKATEEPMSFLQPRQTFAVAIPGQQFSITTTVVNRSQVQIGPGRLHLQTSQNFESDGGAFDTSPLGYNARMAYHFTVKVPRTVEYTGPYWSRTNELRDHIYHVNTPAYLHLPFSPPEVIGVFNYEIDGVQFTLTQPAQTVSVDRVWGEQRRLLTVAPPINIAISPRVGVAPIAASPATFNVNVTVSNNVKGNATGKVRLTLPQGWTATPAASTFRFTHEGEVGNFSFNVSVPKVASGADYKVQAVAEYDGREYVAGYQVIAHRDHEPRHLYRPATMDVRGVEVKVAPHLIVGYVMGVGDEVPNAMEQLGVKVVMLGESDLAQGDLDRFDALIIGIRATAVREDVKAYRKRLLEYAERGGNLIYQYQTQEFDAAPYGPYPYKLTTRAEEVSEEDATVTILDPAHPVFNWPNKITASDFDGWVEERGSKWMTTWDERYRPLLECHDRGQPPQRGGLLYAPYGKGTFVYAAYAFYRQLPAGVQGGYRLFANIISLQKQAR
jgi:LmbE family N-acetylglucosaminyl deacetylase